MLAKGETFKKSSVSLMPPGKEVDTIVNLTQLILLSAV